LAQRHGVHRRTIRQALDNAEPLARKTPVRRSAPTSSRPAATPTASPTPANNAKPPPPDPGGAKSSRHAPTPSNPRWGQIKPSQWGQIKPPEPTSRVREKRPKSPNGVRTVVLDAETLHILTAAKTGSSSSHMFTGRTGTPLRPDNLTGRFNQLADAAGVRAIGPHQIRHMLVSSLLDAGYSLHEIAERLGHHPATLRYYTRVHASRRAGAADNAAALLTPRPVADVAASSAQFLTLPGCTAADGHRIPSQVGPTTATDSDDRSRQRGLLHWCTQPSATLSRELHRLSRRSRVRRSWNGASVAENVDHLAIDLRRICGAHAQIHRVRAGTALKRL